MEFEVVPIKGFDGDVMSRLKASCRDLTKTPNLLAAGYRMPINSVDFARIVITVASDVTEVEATEVACGVIRAQGLEPVIPELVA